MLAAETDTEDSYEAARLARRKVTKSDHSVSSFLFPPVVLHAPQKQIIFVCVCLLYCVCSARVQVRADTRVLSK